MIIVIVLVVSAQRLPVACPAPRRKPFATWAATHRDGPAFPGRVIALWGKFGLLNNRLRCLANAIAFSRREKAGLLLRGPWEMFASSVLDVDWLTHAADAVLGEVDVENATLLSCADAFACGGPCRGAVARAGGQRPSSRTPELYADGSEPVLCGYAAILPRRDVCVEARRFADARALLRGYHQRLETLVPHEPVAKMCASSAARLADRHPFYRGVCSGLVDVPRPFFLASDRFNKTIFHHWASKPGVIVYEKSHVSFEPDPAFQAAAPSAMFRSKLGAALYASSFRGGPNARRQALADHVQPVLVDMLLLASARSFFPTPGSTMSQTVCFWRKAFPPPTLLFHDDGDAETPASHHSNDDDDDADDPTAALRSCEDLVVPTLR